MWTGSPCMCVNFLFHKYALINYYNLGTVTTLTGVYLVQLWHDLIKNLKLLFLDSSFLATRLKGTTAIALHHSENLLYVANYDYNNIVKIKLSDNVNNKGKFSCIKNPTKTQKKKKQKNTKKPKKNTKKTQKNRILAKLEKDQNRCNSEIIFTLVAELMI